MLTPGCQVIIVGMGLMALVEVDCYLIIQFSENVSISGSSYTAEV